MRKWELAGVSIAGLASRLIRGVAPLASSWERSTGNLGTSDDQNEGWRFGQASDKVSWACGPRLEASRATQRETRNGCGGRFGAVASFSAAWISTS